MTDYEELRKAVVRMERRQRETARLLREAAERDELATPSTSKRRMANAYAQSDDPAAIRRRRKGIDTDEEGDDRG